MQTFHNSFKVKSQLIQLTQEEVREVLNEKTYTGTLIKIDEIKKRKKPAVATAHATTLI